MVTKKEKNALGKVASILQIVYMSLSSAVMLLSFYAPGQTRLLEILDYIQRVVKAVLEQSALPRVPNSLMPDVDFTDQLEENPEYAAITAGISKDMPLIGTEGWNDSSDDDEVSRTK